MDKLLLSFLNEVKHCVELYDEALRRIKPSKLNSGIDLRGAKQRFLEFSEKRKLSYDKLNSLFRSSDFDLVEANRYLSTFRSTAKAFDNADCYWSENYDEIEISHNKIFEFLIEIDKKYKLGRYMR